VVYNDGGRSHRAASEALMDHDEVRKLEDQIEKAIAQTFRRLSKERAVKRPSSDRTYHLMAKAAVAVFEAVDEQRQAEAENG
jgi:hypothetical protein